MDDEIITCAHDGCKNPALSILDRAVAGLRPLRQDVPAPGPQGGVHSILEAPVPFPRQHTAVVFTVDLKHERKKINAIVHFCTLIKQTGTPHILLDDCDHVWHFNNLFSCNNYSVPKKVFPSTGGVRLFACRSQCSSSKPRHAF